MTYDQLRQNLLLAADFTVWEKVGNERD